MFKRLLQPLARIMRDPSANDLATKKPTAEMRIHWRSNVESLASMGFHLLLSDSTRAEVIDISYGGIAIRPIPQAYRQTSNIGDEAKLIANGQTLNMRLSFVHESSVKIGYAFIHRDASTLVELRKMLEPFRMGDSLSEIAPEFLKPENRRQGFRVLRGDGPVDLLLNEADGECMLVMLDHDIYRQVDIRKNKFSTSRSQQDPSGMRSPGDLLQVDREPDASAARMAFWVLSGLRSKRPELVSDEILLACNRHASPKA